MRRPVTIEPVALVWLRPVTPAGVGVFAALLGQCPLIVAAWRPDFRLLFRCLVW